MVDTPVEKLEDERPLVRLASLAVLGLGLLALFAGVERFWIVFAVGFAVFVPMVKVASEQLGGDDRRSQRSGESERDALEALRDRYARGELTDEEFERRVERLLETETPESARRYAAGERDVREPER